MQLGLITECMTATLASHDEWDLRKFPLFLGQSLNFEHY